VARGHAQRLAHRLLGRTHRPLPVDRAVHPIEFGRGYCLRIIIEPGGEMPRQCRLVTTSFPHDLQVHGFALNAAAVQ
jgi:NADH:ubiquinone oxidoreductase subunit D